MGSSTMNLSGNKAPFVREGAHTEPNPLAYCELSTTSATLKPVTAEGPCDNISPFLAVVPTPLRLGVLPIPAEFTNQVICCLQKCACSILNPVHSQESMKLRR